MLRAFRRSPSGVGGLIAIAAVILIAVFAPLFLGEQSQAFDVRIGDQGPSAGHWLGTDRLGRDILTRLLVATRLSMGLAVAATALAAAVGLGFGGLTAVLPRRGRVVAQRTIDTALAFPAILVAIFIGSVFGPGSTGVVVGIGTALSFSFARVASTLALSIGGREFVAAARVLGVRGARLLLRYVIPNIADTMVITTSVAISAAIVAISSLSFLGLGVQPPEADWGSMLTQGVQAFYVTPVAALAPAAAIAVAAIAFGLVGEATARAMNPVVWTAWLPTAAGVNPKYVASRADSRSRQDENGSRTDVLRVRDLVVRFPGPNGWMPVVDGISFSVGRGEMFGIVGESGSGKTMTALAIARLVPYPGRVSGVVRVEGRDLREVAPGDIEHFLGTSMAMVFQDPMSSLNPALSVGTQLTEAAIVVRGVPRREADLVAQARLREVRIPAPGRQFGRHPYEFSGGMRQRLMIAMGLMNEPKLLIADEPTTSLDVTVQAQIMSLLRIIKREHSASIVLISHNLSLIAQNCDRVMVMYAGRVAEEGPTAAVVTDPKHPYTRALLDVVPDMTRPRDQRLRHIPGQPPDPARMPAGCRFHTRCPLVADICRQEQPPLLEHADGRRVACWLAEGAPR